MHKGTYLVEVVDSAFAFVVCHDHFGLLVGFTADSWLPVDGGEEQHILPPPGDVADSGVGAGKCEQGGLHFSPLRLQEDGGEALVGSS